MNISARESTLFKIFTAILLLLFFEINYLYLADIVPASRAFKGSFALDSLIPMIPPFIIFYMAGYLFVLLPALFIKTKKDFRSAYITFFLILICSFLIFYFIPVKMEKTLAAGNSFFSSLTKTQQSIDTNLNNFPSLHVSLNTFSAFLCIRYSKKYRGFFLLSGLLIGISTLFVKQHLVIDYAGGLLASFLALKLFRKLLSVKKLRFEIIFYSIITLNISYLCIRHDELLKSIKVIIKFITKF